MRPRRRAPVRRAGTLLGLLALLSCGASAAAPPVAPQPLTDPPEIQSLPGYRTEWVTEPGYAARIFVVEAGPPDAPAVVLVHGIGAQGAADWYGVLPQLAAHHRVLAFDLPGFGRSIPGPDDASPEAYARLVERLATERTAGPIQLIGHSLGAAVALEVAARMPDRIERLMLVDAAGILQSKALSKSYGEGAVEKQLRDLGPLGALLRPLGDRVRSSIRGGLNSVRDLSEYLPLAAGSPTGPNTRAALALVAHDFGPALDAVRAPTLVLWGAQDEVAPLRTAFALTSRLASARLRILDGVGHVPMREAPGRFVEIAQGWLSGASVEPQPPPAGSEDREATCRDRDGQVFEGVYRQIVLDGCREVLLKGVRAGRLLLTDSSAVAEDTRVHAEGVAVSAVRSELTMSGGSLSGEVALETLGSDIDLAGVSLMGSRTAIEAKGNSKLICSVCSIESDGRKSRLHAFRELTAGDAL